MRDIWTCRACAGEQQWARLRGQAQAVKGWCGKGQHMSVTMLRYLPADQQRDALDELLDRALLPHQVDLEEAIAAKQQDPGPLPLDI
jgi:hypothetical protein